MATQMSPASSYSSSSKGWPASMRPHSQSAALSVNQDNLSKKSEEKDVHVDKWASVLRWPKRNNNNIGGKKTKRDPPQVVELYKTITVAETVAGSPAPPPASPWDVAALAKK